MDADPRRFPGCRSSAIRCCGGCGCRRTSSRSPPSGTEAVAEAGGVQAEQRRGDLGGGPRLVPERRPPGDAGLRPPQRRGDPRPGDRPRPRQRTAAIPATRSGFSATTETPFCVYSTSKAITAFVVHKLSERGVLVARRSGRRVHPRLRGQRQGRDHDRPRPRPSRRRSEPAPGGARPRVHRRPRAPPRGSLRRQADLRRRQRSAYHAVSGGFILGEVVHSVTGKDIRTVLAEEFLDPLGFRWMNYGVAPDDVGEVAINYITGPRTAPPLSNAADPRARPSARPAGRDDQRPPLPDRHRPGREHGHERRTSSRASSR